MALSHAVPGVPKEPGSYGVNVPPALIPSPGLLSCLFFNFSNAIKCDTNCLPSVSATTRKRKGKREKKQTHKPGSRHKIILHNTREFKEALPIPPRTPRPSPPPATSPPPLFALMKKGGGDKEEKRGGKHIRRKLLNQLPQSRLGLLIIVFRVQQLGY